MVNLKENIFIQGFNSFPEYDKYLADQIYNKHEFGQDYNNIYQGKTSEIPEEIAKQCVESEYLYGTLYKDYKNEPNMAYKTAIGSIRSACPEPYCIIFKK